MSTLVKCNVGVLMTGSFVVFDFFEVCLFGRREKNNGFFLLSFQLDNDDDGTLKNSRFSLCVCGSNLFPELCLFACFVFVLVKQNKK